MNSTITATTTTIDQDVTNKVIKAINYFISLHGENLTFNILVEHLNYISSLLNIDLRNINNIATNVDVHKYHDLNLLGYYSLKNNLLMIRVLTDYFDFNIDQFTNSGHRECDQKYFALYVACRYGYIDIVKYFCYYFDLRQDIIKIDSEIINISVANNNLDIIKYLIYRFKMNKNEFVNNKTDIFRYYGRFRNFATYEYLIKFFNIETSDIPLGIMHYSDICYIIKNHQKTLNKHDCKPNYDNVIKDLNNKFYVDFINNPKNMHIVGIITNIMNNYDITPNIITSFIKNH